VSSEFVIVTGDEVIVRPPELPPTATYTLLPATPLPVSGSSPHVGVRGLPACLLDDIEKKLVAAFTYVAGAFTVPGNGTISFELEDADKTQKTADTSATGAGGPLVISGGEFVAKFTFKKSAQDPNGVLDPDRQPNTSKNGTASFKTPTKNTALRLA
jgi:hypothetical protein